MWKSSPARIVPGTLVEKENSPELFEMLAPFKTILSTQMDPAANTVGAFTLSADFDVSLQTP